MGIVTRIGRHLRQWIRRGDVARELDEEIAFHLERETEKNLALGLEPEEARRRARASFGGVQQVREAHTEQRALHWISDLGADLAYGARTLRRSPTFVLSTALTLALGIGANVTIFTLADAVLLHPLTGIRAPEELVEIDATYSYPAYRDARDGVRGAELVGSRERMMAVTIDGRTEQAPATVVTGNYFRVLGAGAALGRVFVEDDDRPGAGSVAVLDHAYWRAALGADSSIVGRTLTVNGTPVIVIGVAAPNFHGTHIVARPAFWIPVHTWPTVAPQSYRTLSIESRTWGWMTVTARLTPQVSASALTSAMEAVRAAAASTGGAKREMRPLRARPAVASVLDPRMRTSLVGFVVVLGGVVGLVLLIACANVANLLLARGASRRREIAVRLAVGAGRGRLVRQLLAESALLALVAGVVGLTLSILASRAAGAWAHANGMATDSLQLLGNARALGFALVMTAVTALLFGLAPALQVSRPDHAAVLRDASPFGAGRRLSLRGSLVGIQVALSLVLLVGAGLFVRALQRGLALDPGFATDRLAVATAYLGVTRYDSTRTAAYFDDAASRVAAIAGADGVAWALIPPLTGDVDVRNATIEGYTPAPDEKMELEINAVSADYHRLLGIPVVTGRSFDAGDRRGAASVVLVNETLARRYFADRDAVGRTITFDAVPATVVGVVRDSKYHELDESPVPYVYFPFVQHLGNTYATGASLIVRARGDAAALLPSIAEALRAAGPDVPVSGLTTVDDRVASILAPQRVGVVLLGAFGGLALVVAAVGIYGVVAFGVSQRTREIGVRLALGARAADVTRAIVGRNFRQVLAGLAVGVVLALSLGSVMASFLYGVSPRDLLAFGAAVGTMLVVAIAACLVPARRAARADPVRALKAD